MFTVPGIVQHLFPSLIWRVRTNDKKVYLTFDDGPVEGVTDWVIDQLNFHKAKATFFCVGENIDRSPGLIKLIHQNGNAIGNHTYNHLNGWKNSKKDYQENINKCSESISRCSIKTDLFRPPYGKLNLLALKKIQEKHKIIMWNLLSKDYSSSLQPEKILSKLVEYTRPGSVVVFHDSLKAEKNLRIILPQYLSFLKSEGFETEPLR